MIELQNITYTVPDKSLPGKREKDILKNINLKIEANKIIGIIGESGAGKTTLAKIVAGVIKPSAGKVILNSVTPNKIQILFQNNIELINPYRKVEAILKDVKNIDINRYLELVGLHNSILPKYGNQLSGGERQRIALIRLLATNPALLILDEPFSAQDFESQKSLMQLFLKLNKQLGITILCVSHNLHIMSEFPDRLAVMKAGEIVELNKREELITNPKTPYSEFLFKAMDFNLTESDFDQY